MKNTLDPVVLWSLTSPLLTDSSAPCANAFKRGLLERAKYPLNLGIYKLTEFEKESSRCLNEFQILAHRLRYSQPLRGLCTYGDHAPWIKNRPTALAFEIGWKLLPAINALRLGEVSSTHIEKEFEFYILKIAELINTCEEVLPKIKGPIRHEYERWRDNKSLIALLYIKAISITEAALSLTNHNPLHRYSEK